ncbi:MAG: hypothetical protein IPK17_11335 [Chloroflexi bacterium]|uniref:hypothetical protein n=1 Tax=Candidatus Flexifilum breve TaxID=3140694 RepID=UPI0031361821|nr:hypothetical protein [Chloroflexota bacterium]
MTTLYARLQHLIALRDSCDVVLAELPRTFIAPWQGLPDLPHPALIRTLTGHTDAVNACAGDDRIIVSASSDNTLKVWNTETGIERFTLAGHTGAVLGCAVYGKIIISASSDNTLGVWNAETGMERFTLVGHTGAVLGCS